MGPAYQIHLAYELNPLLCFVVKLKHEAKDITRVYEADNYDVPRVRNLIVEDCLADARFDKLYVSAF